MNLRDLEYFVAVAELGQFKAASEKCFVSQPTLSGQIKKLEEELGQSLFERNTRNVMLSSFGKEAINIVQGILQGVQELNNRAEAMRDPYQGILKVGIFPTLGPWLFPRLIDDLSKSYPDLEIYLLEEKSEVLQEKLMNGDLDTAFLALPQDIKNCNVIPLFSEAFYVAVPDNHPWVKKSSIDVSDIKGQHMLLLNDGHCFRDQALDLCYRYGATERERYRATGIETLRQMVRLGTGITLIPRLAVPDEKETGIEYRPIANKEFKRDIALLYRKTHPRMEMIKNMGEMVRSKCSEKLPLTPIN